MIRKNGFSALCHPPHVRKEEHHPPAIAKVLSLIPHFFGLTLTRTRYRRPPRFIRTAPAILIPPSGEGGRGFAYSKDVVGQ